MSSAIIPLQKGTFTNSLGKVDPSKWDIQGSLQLLRGAVKGEGSCRGADTWPKLDPALSCP